MKTPERIFLAICLGLLSAAAAGCRQEGPFERGGEKMDQAAERAGEAVEEAGERARRD